VQKSVIICPSDSEWKIKMSVLNRTETINSRCANTKMVMGGNKKTGVKVVMVGDSDSGKTTFVLQMQNAHCASAHAAPTIGAQFCTVSAPNTHPDAKKFNLNIWDTAGQERFFSLIRMYTRGTQIAFVFFDVTREISLKNAKQKWIPEVRNGAPSVIVALVANKCDLVVKRVVTSEHGRGVAEQCGALYAECSSLDPLSVSKATEQIFRQISLSNLFPASDVENKDIVHIDNVPRGSAALKRSGAGEWGGWMSSACSGSATHRR
jgi:small GTP-binding protein